MPTRTPTRCTQCNQPATYRGRCPNHQPTPCQTPSTNTQTLTRTQQRHLRTAQLNREPQCRTCGTTTNLEVDHIIELADGGAHTDPDILQTLCTPCHQTKSAAAKKARYTKRKQQKPRKRLELQHLEDW